MLRIASFKGLIGALCFFAVGCASHPPISEYTTARAAYEAAKSSGAAQYASGLWFEAEHTYSQAQREFNDRNFDTALELFQKARSLAERAEIKAKVERAKNGDVDI